MSNVPDIVKSLRREEESGIFSAKVEINQEDSIEFEENSEIIKSSIKINEEADEENSEYNYNDFVSLQKKCKDLENKLKESTERYNSLFEYFEILSETTISLGKKDLFSDVSDIIFQVSPKGRITYINSSVEKITGYHSSNLIGEKLSKIMPGEDWKKIQKHFFSIFNKRNSISKEINSFETFVITTSGRKIPVEINGKLIRNDVEVMGRKNEFKIQGSIRDITERLAAEEERIRNARKIEEMNIRLRSTNVDLKKAQEELRLLNKDLENKVEERTEEIKKLLKHKIEFIGHLGHDLKTPLTPLVGLIPTIEEKEKDPELKELLSVVNRNVLFMRDIVIKTLKIERLNSPEYILNFQKANLFDFVEKNVSKKEFIFNKKNLTVQNNVDKDLTLFIDKFEFNDLLDNILNNSINFTKKGGKIFINSEKEDDFIKVSIKDTGIGLNPDQIEHVFEEFYKADPSRHELDSSGLGLTICKRIVEHHNGKIWVESDGLGKGSTFNFLIPSKLTKK